MNTLDKVKLLKEHFSNMETLECENIEGNDVVTFGTDGEPYVLNFQMNDDTITVTVIDKDEKKAIETYEDSFATEDEFKDKLNDATSAYTLIVNAKPQVEEAIEHVENQKVYDDAVFDVGSIMTACREFFNKYNHEYVKDEHAQFNEDLKTVLTDIYTFTKQLELKLPANLWESVDAIEEPMSEPEEPVENNSKEVSPKNTKTADEASEMLEEFGEIELLQILTNKLNARAEEAEDEITERVVSDVAIQCEELVDELSRIIEE